MNLKSKRKNNFILYLSILTILIFGIIGLFILSEKKKLSPDIAIELIQSKINFINQEAETVLSLVKSNQFKDYQNDSLHFVILDQSTPVHWNYSTRIDSFTFFYNKDLEISKYFYDYNDTFFYCIKAEWENFHVILYEKLFHKKGTIFDVSHDEGNTNQTFPFHLEIKNLEKINDYSHHVIAYSNQKTPVAIYDYNYITNTYFTILLHIAIVCLLILGARLFKHYYSKFNRYYLWFLYTFIIIFSAFLFSHEYIIYYGFKNSDFFRTIVFTYFDLPFTLGQVFYISLLFFTVVLSYYNNVYQYITHNHSTKIWNIISKMILLLLYLFIFLPFTLHIIRDNENLYLFYDFSRVNYKSIIALFIIIINLISIIIFSYTIIPYRKSTFTIIHKIIIILLYIVAYSYFIWRFEEIENHYFEFAFVCLAFYLFVAYTLPPVIKRYQHFKKSYFQVLSYNGFIWTLVICIWVANIIFISNFQNEKLLRQEIANSLIISNDHVSEFRLQQKLDEWLVTNADNTDQSLHTKIRFFAKDIFSNFTLDKIDYFSENTLPNSLKEIITSNAENPTTTNIYSKLFIEFSSYILLYEYTEALNEKKYISFHFSIPKFYAKKKLELFNEKSSYSPYYSVAIFYNNKIVSISELTENPSEYEIHLSKEGFHFTLNASFYTLKLDNGQTIIIKYNRLIVLQYLTTLSYCIIILYIFSFLLIYSNNSNRLIRLEYKDKINIGIISIVSIAFLLLSFISINYLYSEFDNDKNKNTKLLKINYDSYVYKIVKLLKEEIITIPEDNKLEIVLEKFPYTYQYGLYQLDEIEFFQTNGVKYENGIKSVLDKYVLNQLNEFLSHKKQEDYQISESPFTIFYENENNIYYYIHINSEINGILKFPIPNFESGSHSSVNNIITILINTYVLLFLLSILVTILIVNNLTNGIQTLIKQIRKFSLTKNTPIKYDKNDEIAVLVKEYNSMLKNVEIMAANLAESERESAWREAAKQVAHEINNPITPIKLNIQYLIKAAENNNDISALFLKVSKSIIQEIDKLSEIAQSFSNYGRMTEPILEKIDIINHVKSVVTILYVDLNIKLNINHPDEILYVNADGKFLNIIFMNIIKNAFQALENIDNPELNVTIYTENKRVLIEINDNGIGMSEEVKNKIFAPNFTTKSSGKGIGLSTTKAMIISMNGNIVVTSKKGFGTTFTISFPLQS